MHTPQRIFFLSAPERDVTYTPLGLNFFPKFHSINAEINVSQYHKSIYQTKMETTDAYHLRPPRSPSAYYNCPTGP